MPTIMMETASVLCPRSATRSATMEPTPKKAPCGRPETSRMANRVQYPGDRAAQTLPAIIMATRISRICFRGRLRAMSTTAGAPMQTPSA